MRLEKNTAAKCAAMSKIHLTPEETAAYEAQLQELFGWVKQLSTVDVSSVPESAIAQAAFLRPDEPVTDEALSNTLVNAFNDQEGHCAKVKKVL